MALSSDNLKELINHPDRKERECSEYIELIGEFLIPQYSDKDITYIKKEYIGNKGRVDYILITKIEEGGDTNNRAYFWELKAPQCNIFINDESSDERLGPSPDLIDAENQLLYYYYEHKHNDGFIREYELGGPDNVCLGGIIISSEEKKVYERIAEKDKERLYGVAFRIRTKILYDEKIRLMTWDDIHKVLCSLEEGAKPIEPTDVQLTEIPIPTIPDNAKYRIEEEVT